MEGYRPDTVKFLNLVGQMQDCNECPLRALSPVPVMPRGSIHSKLVIIGLCPGAEEVTSGNILAGPGGDIFNEILTELGIDDEHVFITNTVLCRPHDGDTDCDPNKEESVSCSTYLSQQLDIIRPTVIMTLGVSAYHSVVGKRPSSMTAVRGTTNQIKFEWGSAILVPTFHQSYLHRMAEYKQFKFLRDAIKSDIQKAFSLTNM